MKCGCFAFFFLSRPESRSEMFEKLLTHFFLSQAFDQRSIIGASLKVFLILGAVMSLTVFEVRTETTFTNTENQKLLS